MHCLHVGIFWLECVCIMDHNTQYRYLMHSHIHVHVLLSHILLYVFSDTHVEVRVLGMEDFRISLSGLTDALH